MNRIARFFVGIVVAVALLATSSVLYAGGNILLRDPSDPSASLQQTWSDMALPIRWVLSSDGYPGSGITNNDIQSSLQAAFDTWEQLPTSRLSFTYDGEVNARSAAADGKNLLSFTDSDFVFAPGVLAVAVLSSFSQDITIDDTNNDLDGDGVQDLTNGFYPAGSIYDADIVFDGSDNLSNTGSDGSLDIQAIALHEIGHFFSLAHSVIEDTVMYPFLSANIASARTPKPDDIAYASYFYPQEPTYSSAFGAISGRISNGQNGQRILGAHVYVVDAQTGVKTVGAYSLEQGNYLIPGLVPGSYYIGIEPLDGAPQAADPDRINAVIAATLDTSFPEELYDLNESNIETDPLNAQPVFVNAGSESTDINLITNNVELPGFSQVLVSGLNLFAYPVEAPQGFTAYDLLQALGNGSEINSIDRFNPLTGEFERAAWVNGSVGGTDFSITRGEGYLMHMQSQKLVSFAGRQDCPGISLHVGLNLIGVPCSPAGYSAFDLLASLGSEFEVDRILKFDETTGNYVEAYYQAGVAAGIDFSIRNGEAYIVEMFSAKQDVIVPGQNQIFPPGLNAVSPGRSIPGASVLLVGLGFSSQAVDNDVRFNGVRAAVTFASGSNLVVTVPDGASSGPVNVTIDNKTSNSIEFLIDSKTIDEQAAKQAGLVSGQTVQADLSAPGEQDRYTFVALQGSRVSLQARSITPGIPDLLLFLEGLAGEVLASDDNSGTGTDPRINKFELPETGTYTVVVTNVPDTGIGAYELTINIETVTSEPVISVIGGQYQSAIAGTELPVPVNLLVTGPTGAPMAGVPVVLVTSSDEIGVTPGGFTAASFTVQTNSNGIVAIKISLPNTIGIYNIDVTAPGQNPATIVISSLSAEPASVEITGNNQTCTAGCTVGQPLPQPYKLRFLDNNLQPVIGILTSFRVVSGGGSLQGHVPAPNQNAFQVTGANGEVSVIHTLGTQLFDEFNNPISQLVAAVATLPQDIGPILFGAMAKADSANKLESRTTGFNRMTMQTSRLNAIRFDVTDQYGNPVANAPVVMNGNGLDFAPGFLNGAFLPSMATNQNGEFVGMVSATGLPTIDEFGGVISPPYQVTASVAGVLDTISVNVDVDMGPNLVGTTATGGAAVGDAQWITLGLGKPVVMELRRFQRVDACDDTDNNNQDDDQGYWQDEEFDLQWIAKQQVPFVTVNFSAYRSDGNEDLLIERPTVSPVAVPVTPGVTTTAATNVISMGGAHGEIVIHAETPTFSYPYQNTDICHGPLVLPSIPLTTFLTGDSGPLKNNGFLNAVSPLITIALNDNPASLPEPNPDPYPSKNSYSGLDLTTAAVNLNGKALFDGNATSGVIFNQYPNFMRVWVDQAEVGSLDPAFVQYLNPGTLTIEYRPTNTQITQGQNSIQILPLKDKAGHEITPAATGFTFP